MESASIDQNNNKLRSMQFDTSRRGFHYVYLINRFTNFYIGHFYQKLVYKIEKTRICRGKRMRKNHM